MLDWNHYVPVLRWKAAERKALETISENVHDQITPLIEAVPRYSHQQGHAKTLRDVLTTFPDDVYQCRGTRPLFLSAYQLARILPPDHLSSLLRTVSERAAQLRMQIIPVIDLNEHQTVRTALLNMGARLNAGVCIRVHAEAIPGSSIASLPRQLNIEPSELHLVINAGASPEAGVSFFGSLPELHRWKSLTFCSGAFPENLAGFEPGSHLIPRGDWTAWKSLCNAPHFSSRG